jgi:hypothetical protein
MKLSFFYAVLAIAFSLMIEFGFYHFCNCEAISIQLATWLAVLLPLFFMMAVKFSNSRTGVNIKTVSVLFLMISLLNAIFFAMYQFSSFVYMELMGLYILVFLSLVHFIAGEKQ